MTGTANERWERGALFASWRAFLVIYEYWTAAKLPPRTFTSVATAMLGRTVLPRLEYRISGRLRRTFFAAGWPAPMRAFALM